MPVETLQQLCCAVVAKQSTHAQIDKLSLHKSLKSLIITERENAIVSQQNPNMKFNRFNLYYCCKSSLIPYDPITNGYFKALYDEHIKTCSYSTVYCEESGYGLSLYAPGSIEFTTKTGDVYCISYNAYTSNCSSNSNWNRKIEIRDITYQRNGEQPKELHIIFLNGGGCCGLVKYRDNASRPYTMSYIALNDDMNYIGHYFDRYMFKSVKHKQLFTKQLTDLIDKNKTSKLPFFVNFLESIPDPILRLIYLFTYMPSVRVVSGK